MSKDNHSDELRSVKMEELSWTDIDSALQSGVRSAIIAIGSTEQHGPHMPLGMDALYGEDLAVRIAEELGDTLVAPPIRPGCSGHHMEFPGTITVPASLLMELIREYCFSLESHGFDCIILMPTHGGNFAPVSTVAPEIARELDDADIITLSDLNRILELMNEGLQEVMDFREPVIHAGAAETSLLLALRERLVQTERLETGYEGHVNTAELLSEGFKHFTENGILGDATKASTEAGERIVETLVDAYSETVRTKRKGLGQ